METKDYSQLKILPLLLMLFGLVQMVWSMDSRYYGQSGRIKMNFSSAPVENAIPLIAKYSGKKIEISPQIRGTITIALDNIPWYQALDAILKVHHLQKVETADTIRFEPIGRALQKDFSTLKNEAMKISSRHQDSEKKSLSQKPLRPASKSQSFEIKPSFETEMDGVNIPVARKIETLPSKENLESRVLDITEKIRISGITGTDDNKVAIAEVSGKNRLLRTGNVVEGFYEVKTIEDNGVQLVDTRNQNTHFITF